MYIYDVYTEQNFQLVTLHFCVSFESKIRLYKIHASLNQPSRLRAKKGPAPPLGNFADISYLEENFKPHLLRDVCTLCSGALVSDSLLHMLL